MALSLHWLDLDILCSRWMYGASFLEIQGGQQQHANKHGDGGWEREKYRSYHAIRKNIGSHDLS
jgi:hypothetical protein